LRKDEADQVCKTFTEQYRDINFEYVDASRRFLDLMRGVTKPEEKRVKIGNEFVATFERETKRLGAMKYLAQGTLYPDVIESGSGKAAKIKTHHNVGGLPEDMDFELIEPFRTCSKTRCAHWAKRWACPATSSGDSHFPAPD
jgi:GMP synthase (glutamine-hydrolysing)